MRCKEKTHKCYNCGSIISENEINKGEGPCPHYASSVVLVEEFETKVSEAISRD